MLSFKRKNLLLFSLLAFLSIQTVAQIYDPVQWKHELKVGENGEAEIVLTADIEDKWHIYATVVADEEIAFGPLPTEILIEAGSGFEIVGKPTDPGYITHSDPAQNNMTLNYHENRGVFTQKIKILNEDPFVIKGSVSFMVCDDSKCLPPEYYDFEIPVNGAAATTADAGGATNGIEEPTKWTVSSTKTGDNTYTIDMTAKSEEGWHIYAMVLPSNEGPFPTVFTFTEENGLKLDGGTTGPEAEVHFDPNFDMDVAYHEGEVTFSQKVIADNPGRTVFTISYMVCNDEKCLFPPDTEYFVDLKKNGIGGEVALEGEITEEIGKFTPKLTTVNMEEPIISDCSKLKEDLTNTSAVLNENQPLDTEEDSDKKSLAQVFFLGFLGGLIALLTPCVFPMIPLTVSFFTKGSEDRKRGTIRAMTYGFFIFLIYIIFSIPFHVLEGVNADIFNVISTSISLNIVFFIILIVFAISFFGYFEITLPSSIANKADNASGNAGLIGIFFMAITLAIVSFSCTGPILGTLLVGAVKDGAWPLTAGMGGFGLALGIPFALFAAFPGIMNSLPKSGGWLNSVKVVLGFVEVALAFKFLSNADYKMHWGILKYEVFIGLWIITGILLALYLFGKLKFPHDSPIKKLSPIRMGLGILVIVFTGYLFTGFRYNEEIKTYQSLKLLSGLAPPVTYSWLYPLECPNNIDCEKDFLAGQERAKKENKMIMIDFTGFNCVNCRKMEEHVWIEKEISDLIDQTQLISLYVDSDDPLPEEMQINYTSPTTGKTRKLEDYGDLWSIFEMETFETNTQPLYCLLTPDGQLINSPVGYTPNVDVYREWLECGLDAFNSKVLSKN